LVVLDMFMGFYQYRHLFGDTGKESIAKQITRKKKTDRWSDRSSPFNWMCMGL